MLALPPPSRIHNKPMNKMWEWTNTGEAVPVTAKAMLPSTSAVTIELAHGISMITFVNTVSGTGCTAPSSHCMFSLSLLATLCHMPGQQTCILISSGQQLHTTLSTFHMPPHVTCAVY